MVAMFLTLFLLVVTVDTSPLKPIQFHISELTKRKDYLEESLGLDVLKDGWAIPPSPFSKVGHKLAGWFRGHNDINALVLGCSSTTGTGTDNEYYADPPVDFYINVKGVHRQIYQNNTFFNALGSRLMDWSRPHLSKTKFLNAAHGGEISFYQAQLMDSIVHENTDILFWEFALTDSQFHSHHPDGTTVSLAGIVELFLKQASELKSKPSIVFVYFWDVPWPMKCSTWIAHQETIKHFRNEYGMDISVLLGGQLAMNVSIEKLGFSRMNASLPRGDVVKQIRSRGGTYSYSNPEGGYFDHHPSKWTHDRVREALEYGFANLTLHVLNSHNDTTREQHQHHQLQHQIHRHLHVRHHYRPSSTVLYEALGSSYSNDHGNGNNQNSNEIIKNKSYANVKTEHGNYKKRRYDGGQYRYLSNMTVSITSMQPQFGQRNNHANVHAYDQLEEGSKVSSYRKDRKIDATILSCNDAHYSQDNNNNINDDINTKMIDKKNKEAAIPFEANFGSAPQGLRWSSFELTVLPTGTLTQSTGKDKNKEPTLVLTISNKILTNDLSASNKKDEVEGGGDTLVVRRRMDSSLEQCWKGVKAYGMMIDLEIELKEYLIQLQSQQQPPNNREWFTQKLIEGQKETGSSGVTGGGWTDHLTVEACIDNYDSDLALRWALAFAVPQ
mmetsp:Transcript_11382/g.14668  ORF Transcript_11382/g.14668 Transcript_11382/m.14668 type:complete len:668 (-) Transcript_11382:98-2101(-)